MIHSVAGLLDGGRLVTRPPSRSPASGASQAALVGGGCRFYRPSGVNIESLESCVQAVDGGTHAGRHRPTPAPTAAPDRT